MDKDELAFISNTISYDSTTGALYKKQGRYAGKNIARYHASDGYLRIHLNHKFYQAHRMAWFLHYGIWPVLELDHINGDKTDNRIVNLREVDCRTNQHNQQRHREGSIPGIHCSKNGEFKARFRINGKRVETCYYDDIEKAIKAYIRLRAREGIPVQPDDLFSQAVERYGKNIPPE